MAGNSSSAVYELLLGFNCNKLIQFAATFRRAYNCTFPNRKLSKCVVTNTSSVHNQTPGACVLDCTKSHIVALLECGLYTTRT